MRAGPNRAAADVLGVAVDAISMEDGLGLIVGLLEEKQRGYICVADVHGVMEANRSVTLAKVYADSLMTIPDGMPLAWIGRLQGHERMERVTGPDVMLQIFARPEFAGFTHYLYGGIGGVAEQLRARLLQLYPWVKITGCRTPPFHELTPDEARELIEELAEVKPDIVWVGLGCPKQEIFMARFSAILDTRLMIGVGAAFDYHTGRIRDCCPWVKRIGMQWLHRLLQDPRRLWRRYLRNNSAFLWQLLLQYCGLRSQSMPCLIEVAVQAAKRNSRSLNHCCHDDESSTTP